MKRVLHIIPQMDRHSGGPSEALRRYCKALEGRVQLSIATSTQGLTKNEMDELRETLPAVSIRFFEQVGVSRIYLALDLCGWLWRESNSYDLVHIHSCFSPTNTIAAWICRMRQMPYILRPLGTLSKYGVRHGRSFFKKIYLAMFERATISGAAALHFTAEEERLTMPSQIGYRRYAIIPIPFMDSEYANDSSSSHEKRSRDIIFISRIHPKKALEILLSAFRVALELSPETLTGARLIIAGSGDPKYVKSLKDMAKDLERDGRVIWRGFVQGAQKAELIRSGLVFCLASYQENFGVAVAEAMAAGLPVIISDQVALCHDVLEYDAGKVVPAGDVERLATAIVEMIQDPEGMRKQSHNARSLVAAKYGQTAVRDALVALYRSIARHGETEVR